MIDYGVFEEYIKEVVPVDFNFHDWMILNWSFQLTSGKWVMQCCLVGSFDNENLVKIQIAFDGIKGFKLFPEIEEVSHFWIEKHTGGLICYIQGFRSMNTISITCNSVEAFAIEDIEDWPSR